MNRQVLTFLMMLLAPVSAFAVDGVTLINQSTVMAAGGFPYFILQAGSYRLSGNLLVPAGASGINIIADNVMLDLNGFTIKGPGAATSIYAVGVYSGKNVTIKNGTTTGFPVGVQVGAHAVVTDVQANANGTGFAGFGTGLVIVGCAANLNTGDGFEVTSATILNSVANANGGSGFKVGSSTLIQNVANNNVGYGFETSGATIDQAGSIFGSNMSYNNGHLPLLDARSKSEGNNLTNGGVW
jgi:hypothetical protein